MNGSLLFVFSCLVCFSVVLCSSSVPVLIWNTNQESGNSLPAVSALQQLSVEGLQAHYLDAFMPDNILLFLQDTLSIEDLSSHNAELQHLQNTFSSAGHSLYLPNVQQPSDLQHQLVLQGYKVSTVSAGSAVSSLTLDHAEKNLVVVKLPPTATNPSRSRALRKSDEVMQSVLSKIGAMADFTVIYTGIKPSLESESTGLGERTRVVRSVSDDDDPSLSFHTPPRGFYKSVCVLLYIRRNMTISFNGTAGPYFDIPESKMEDPISSCPDTKNSILLHYNNVMLGDTLYKKLKIGFQFELLQGAYWRLVSALVILTKDVDPDSIKMDLVKWYDSSVPLGMSYSCNLPLIFTQSNETSLDPPQVLQLVLNGVQVEPFNYNPKFNAAWDCVGFFTIPIWQGLLASLLMVVVLAMGMYMLADIKTMDRFDDPKGKTIMVPQATD